MKRRLCVDIDNCVAATDAVMRRIISAVTDGRVNFRYDDIREFDYHGILCKDCDGNGIDEAIWKRVHDQFSEPDVVGNIEPLPGAVETLRILQQEFEIHFVTTRKPRSRVATIDWLDRLALDSDRPYWTHFVAHREKHEVITGIAAAIDDDACQAESFQGCGVRAIVLAHPWNYHLKLGIERFVTWTEIADALLGSTGVDSR